MSELDTQDYKNMKQDITRTTVHQQLPNHRKAEEPALCRQREKERVTKAAGPPTCIPARTEAGVERKRKG